MALFFPLRTAVTRVAGACLACMLGFSAAAATDTLAFPATLAGHAVLPALSVLPAPADAPADLRSSGKYTMATPTRHLGTVEGQFNARTPAAPDVKPAVFPVKRSQGFEGMAASPDGHKLYPLLEGPLCKADAGAYDQARTARPTCARWSSTWPARAGRAATGNTRWKRPAMPSATST